MNYDHELIGVGNPMHPANIHEATPQTQYKQCDSCNDWFPEDELNIDRYKGKDTGWRWCDECLKEMEEEEKLTQGKEKAAVGATAIV